MSYLSLPTVRLVCLVSAIGALAGVSAAQDTGTYSASRPFGTLRQQAAVQQAWLKERLEVNLPAVMRAHGVDMWVVTMREDNEDPVFRGLVSASTFAARRRSIYIFFDRGPQRGVERLALGGTSQGGSVRGLPRRAKHIDDAEGRAVGHGPVAAVREAGA